MKQSVHNAPFSFLIVRYHASHISNLLFACKVLSPGRSRGAEGARITCSSVQYHANQHDLLTFYWLLSPEVHHGTLLDDFLRPFTTGSHKLVMGGAIVSTFSALIFLVRRLFMRYKDQIMGNSLVQTYFFPTALLSVTGGLVIILRVLFLQLTIWIQKTFVSTVSMTNKDENYGKVMLLYLWLHYTSNSTTLLNALDL